MLPLTIELRRSTVAGDLERLQPREQVTEDRLELDARDVCAHAEVLAEAEREMRVRAAIDAERERVVEHLLVAVRRREVQRHLLPRPDRHAAHLAVLGRGPGEVADRAGPAQDLLDGVGQQVGIGAQLLPLVAVLAEREQPAADRVARRLVARLDEELAVRDELLLGERRPVDLAADQLAHQIVLRVAPALVDQAPEVGVHLAAGALDRLAGRLARAPVLRIVLADHLVGPAEQQLPVVARHAEDPGDHRERERRGDAFDEVELARRRPRARPRRGSRSRSARCRRAAPAPPAA